MPLEFRTKIEHHATASAEIEITIDGKREKGSLVVELRVDGADPVCLTLTEMQNIIAMGERFEKADAALMGDVS